MMHNWFECKVRYEKIAENGMTKKVTEPYLVDALSFTEAESRIIEEITPFISGEFTVADIKRANYSELFPCEDDAADRWFKCKLYFITLDEKSGAEKRTATNILVQASDLRDAVKKLDEGMKDSMADYSIASIAETAIMDVYPYSNDETSNEPVNREPSVLELLSECQEGTQKEFVIKGKKVIVDKTGKNTVVRPASDSQGNNKET